MRHYCFKADCECDLDIDAAFMDGYKDALNEYQPYWDMQNNKAYIQGYEDALEDFEKALLQNNVIDKSVVRRTKEQLSRNEE